MKKIKLVFLSFLMLVIIQSGLGNKKTMNKVYANNLSVRQKLDKLSNKTIKAGNLKSTDRIYKAGEFEVPVYTCSDIGYVFLSDLKQIGANIAWDPETKKTIMYDLQGEITENPKFQELDNIPAYLGRHNVYFNYQEVPAIFGQNKWLIPLKWVEALSENAGHTAYNVINNNPSWTKEKETHLIKGVNVWFDGKDYIEKEYTTNRLSDFGYNDSYINQDNEYVGYIINEVDGILNPEKDVHKAWLKNPTYYNIPKVDLKALFPPTIKKGIPTNKVRASKENIEGHINSLDMASSTDYLVWTDISRQRTYVFKGSKNNWTLIKDILSTTGKDTSPTPRGTYKLGTRVPAFGYGKGYIAKNAYGFIGTKYLYHSVLYDSTGTYLLTGGRELGSQDSAGCIRLAPEDSVWLYKNMPSGTKVYIN